MKTHIVKNTWIEEYKKEFKDTLLDSGWGNGYVILDRIHPWAGVDYWDIPVEVHGGLTFGRYLTKEDIYFFSIDPEDVGKYMIGFDTAHYGDNITKWSKDAVQEEADRLLRQCIINNIPTKNLTPHKEDE